MKKCLFIILGCFVMLTGCKTNTESNTQTTVSENKTKSNASYTKNDTVVSHLTNSYYFTGMDAPVVDFDPSTNTYVTIAKSKLDANKFNTVKNSDEWNNFVSTFCKLADSSTGIAQDTDKTINIKVILVSSDEVPILETVNKDKIFDFFNTDDSQTLKVLLESYICSNKLGVANISFDKGTNTYTANITKEGLNKDFASSPVWEQYAENTAKLQPLVENITHAIDKDSNVIVQYIDSYNGDKLLTIENGAITYNCQE